MTKNPLLNAAAASLYISVVSLFTLSAAVMGYLFLYQPGQLYLEGKKKQAVNLFLQTVAIFAGITATFLLILFSGLV